MAFTKRDTVNLDSGIFKLLKNAFGIMNYIILFKLFYFFSLHLKD